MPPNPRLQLAGRRAPGSAREVIAAGGQAET